MQYLTKAGVKFLEEALTRRQKLGIGLTAGAATLFGASKLGGKVSSPTPPSPNIVQQQPQGRARPTVLQRPKASQEKTAISSIADKKKEAAVDLEAVRRQNNKNKVGEWKKTIKIRGKGDINKSFSFPHGTGGHTYTRQDMEHMLNVHPDHKDYGRKPIYDGDTFMGYHDK